MVSGPRNSGPARPWAAPPTSRQGARAEAEWPQDSSLGQPCSTKPIAELCLSWVTALTYTEHMCPLQGYQLTEGQLSGGVDMVGERKFGFRQTDRHGVLLKSLYCADVVNERMCPSLPASATPGLEAGVLSRAPALGLPHGSASTHGTQGQQKPAPCQQAFLQLMSRTVSPAAGPLCWMPWRPCSLPQPLRGFRAALPGTLPPRTGCTDPPDSQTCSSLKPPLPGGRVNGRTASSALALFFS